jgi:hypothetical protein
VDEEAALTAVIDGAAADRPDRRKMNNVKAKASTCPPVVAIAPPFRGGMVVESAGLRAAATDSLGSGP